MQITSNESYLSLEFQLLERRLVKRQEVLAGSARPSHYYALVNAQFEERMQLVAARRAAVARGVEIPFDEMARRYELSSREEHALLLCLTPHLCASVWDLVRHVEQQVDGPHLEVGFVSELIDPAPNLLTRQNWCARESPLIRAGLLVLTPPASAVGPPAGVLSFLVHAPHFVAASAVGTYGVATRLNDFCEICRPSVHLSDVVLTEAAREAVDTVMATFYRRGQRPDLSQRAWTLLVSGPEGSGKSSLVEGLAHALGRVIFRIYLPGLEPSANAASRLRMAFQNAQFLDAMVHVVGPQALRAHTPATSGTLRRLLPAYRGIVVLEPSGTEELDSSFEPLVHFAVDLESPDVLAREQLWESLLPEEVTLAAGANLSRLASTYELSGGQIRFAIDWALQAAKNRQQALRLTQHDLEAGALTQLRSKLANFTDSAHSSLGLDALVLEESVMKQVCELLAACRNRHLVMNEWGFNRRLSSGRGLITLFTGDPGTGKTFTAQLLANELALSLRIVSIPKVVSKWLGETEKNIKEIFAHAKAHASILLFDEADSLFTTRVKVERSQDSYQNMAVNVLLQEIERFDGVVILTTNLEANFDRAFERRILFKIEFPFPKEVEREQLWRSLIPESVPLAEDLDLQLLSKAFELSGGQIKNAVLRAAFRCAGNDSALTQSALEEAAQRQYRSEGRLAAPLEELRAKGGD